MDTGQFRSVVSRALGQVVAGVYPLDLRYPTPIRP